MPTHNGAKVRVLLKQKRAEVVSKCPFTIKLLYESTSFTQPLTLGVDTGSKYVGSAVINDITSEIVYESQTELRDDVKSKMDRRRAFRRGRRNKLRYRPKRFNNRKASKRKDRYSPTLISKFQGHTREIEFIKSILPITDVVLEVGEFDPQLLHDPTLAYHKWDYSKGELYQQENFKQAARARDDYKCQCCGKKGCRLEVHHLLPRSRGGSDKLANLITLCSDCHHLAHSSEEQLLVFQRKFGKKAKKAGLKVGRLQYKHECNEINLKQFGNTYKIKSHNKISVQGIGVLVVNGLKQINLDEVEFANAKLIKKPSGFYIHLTATTNSMEAHCL